MWNVRNSIKDHKIREGKLKGKSSKTEENHERWLTLEINWELLEGRLVGDGVIGGFLCID